MSIVVGTGYFKADQKCEDFFEHHWLPNTLRFSNPDKVFVVNSASPEIQGLPNVVEWLNLTRNPEHGSNLKENVQFGGWSLGFIHGALYAYSCNCDYIYKEQDCLAFGNWVERMYSCCENKKMVTGELWNHNKRNYIMELCLVLIKYDFILPFLAELLSNKGTANKVRPEKKFLDIRDNHPEEIGTLDFGYGGNRPFKISDCFYIQKPRWNYQIQMSIKTKVGSGVPVQEIELLKSKGLL